MTLKLLVIIFLFTRRTLALKPRARGKASADRRFRSAHHLVGDHVRFALKAVTGLIDGEWFRVVVRSFLVEQAQHCLVAHSTLKTQQAWRRGRRRPRAQIRCVLAFFGRNLLVSFHRR